MKLWRIAGETREYKADDLSGAGAAKEPGRWNAKGEPVIYSAPAISLAVLETTAHIDDAGLPLNRYLVEIDVPDDIWAARDALDITALPIAWSAIPAGKASVDIGSEWLASLRSAILLVPSVIVPDERVSLVNPKHPDAARITARTIRIFEYNRVLR